MYRTTDGGDTWSGCPTTNVDDADSVSEFYRLDMLDSRHGWAVGTTGTILATSDGEHWVVEHSGTRRNLWGVSFVDPANGWVAGDGGVILKDPGPICYAPPKCVVRRGSVAKLKFKVSAAAVVRLKVTIKVRNSSNRTVYQIVLKNGAPNKVSYAKFRCRLKRGNYTVYVYATDSAGMKAAVPAMNRLIVR